MIETEPSATATAGQAFSTQPVIWEEDQYGNLETADSSTVVTASLAPAPGRLQGQSMKRFRAASRPSPTWPTTWPKRLRSSSSPAA